MNALEILEEIRGAAEKTLQVAASGDNPDYWMARKIEVQLATLSLLRSMLERGEYKDLDWAEKVVVMCMSGECDKTASWARAHKYKEAAEADAACKILKDVLSKIEEIQDESTTTN